MRFASVDAGGRGAGVSGVSGFGTDLDAAGLGGGLRVGRQAPRRRVGSGLAGAGDGGAELEEEEFEGEGIASGRGVGLVFGEGAGAEVGEEVGIERGRGHADGVANPRAGRKGRSEG